MGVKPIRFQVTIMISLLILMSTPIGQAEESQGTMLDIEMGYWVNGNWNPLTTSFEFEITEFWALERPVMLDVRGSYGSFGSLYVDKLKMDVIKTSMERPEITENAVLGPLEFDSLYRV